MTELDQDVYKIIKALCNEGDLALEDDDLADAYRCYREAWDLVPDPKTDLEASTWILSALGDVYFFSKDYQNVIQALEFAMLCPDGLGNPYLHLRLGQAYFESGDMNKAADHLTRCYMGSELDLLNKEDKKYLNYLESVIDM